MAAGAGDAWVEELIDSLDAVDGPVWLAFHHEPEGDGPIQDWVSMQQRLAPMVRDGSDNIAFSIIVTGWNQLYGDPQYSFANMWPGDGLVDVIGVDVYQHYGTEKNGVINMNWVDLGSHYFEPIAEFAASKDTAWGLAETGFTDRAFEYRPTWMQETYDAVVENDGVAFAYFNTWLNNNIGTWYLADQAKRDTFGATLEDTAYMITP